MIPRETLERWKALADAATPGPWEYLDNLVGYPEVYQCAADCDCGESAAYKGNTVFDDSPQGTANAKFIAAAREAVPALIAEVEAQAKEIERLRAALRKAERVLRASQEDRPEDFGASAHDALWAVEAALKETP